MKGLLAKKPTPRLVGVDVVVTAVLAVAPEVTEQLELVAVVADLLAAPAAEAEEPLGGIMMTSTCNQASAPEIS